MKKSYPIRFLTMLLVAAMLISTLPIIAFATDGEQESDSASQTEENSTVEIPTEEETLGEEVESILEDDIDTASASSYTSETHEVFSTTTSTIAPGVTQSINYAYASDGKQMVYYVATADVSREDVVVQTSYLNAQCEVLGMSKLTEQMAAADSVYSDPNNDKFISEDYTAVAGVNASFYNMTTGQPSGYTVMDGVYFGTTSYDNFFAILDDGTAVIDYRSNLSQYEDHVWQAVGGSMMLVYNGKDITASASGSYSTDRHSRTCVGVTADGEVVLMVLDGRQEPFSCGGSMHELAQIMLEQGCVAAINLDGGGSTTYAARQEGANEVTIVNRPSDGSERSISAGLIIGSLAIPSDTFDHATLTAESSYVTPGSTVNVTATGVSPAGTAAEIPEDVSWQLEDSGLGTVENGMFTSSGITGDAVVQLVYDGAVVGSTTIHVVVPDTVEFSSGAITVPYGKTIKLELTATYGLNEVTLKAEDFNFALSDEAIGTLDGFNFTSTTDESVTESTITATLVHNTTVTASSTITLGKGSEVIWDFEDGTTNGFGLNYTNYNYYLPNQSVSVATAETGQVHSGEYSLALNIDYSNSLESGYQMISLYQTGVTLYAENAKSVGMWIYIPDECVGLWARWMLHPITAINKDGSYTWDNSAVTGQNMDDTAGGTGVVYSFEESGWHYLSIDMSSYLGAAILPNYYMVQFYISDRDGSAYDYYFKNQHNVNGNFTFYIDDITIDYSSAIDDREAPVFSSLTYATTSMSDAVSLTKGTVPTVSGNVLSFVAKVAENMTKSNATGIDVSTAKAYVDGNEVACTYSNGTISLNGSVTLADGQHTIKFSICDKQGNCASIIRQINVQAGSETPTIKVVPRDETQNRMLLGSLYYVDVVATDIEQVQSVTTVLDLDNMSDWELEHMTVAVGFEVSYSLQLDENIATLTITRTGTVSATGEAVLVSIPVRVWFLENSNKVNPLSDKEWTLAQFFASKEFWPIYVDIEVDRGTVTYTDGRVDYFSGEGIETQTEMWASYSNMVSTAEGLTYYNSWNGGHTHSAEVLEDKSATCTEDGYTNRTYCEECSSVVDWGTTVSATGHSYDFVEGVLQCTVCDETYTGTWTDGKAYVDGLEISDGWVGESYYVDGVKLTGIQKVIAPDGSGEYYYDFAEDGICVGYKKYTGFIYDDYGKFYVSNGLPHVGWLITMDESVYYLGTPYNGIYYAMSGKVKLGSPLIEYTFDSDGVLISGNWYDDGEGMRYYWAGVACKHEFREIDGETYFFDAQQHIVKGIQGIALTHGAATEYYWFDEETGALRVKFEGDGLKIYGDYEHVVYLEDGVPQYVGLVQDDEGNYYYVNSTKEAVKNCTYSISEAKTNGLLPAGTYTFDEDGKMVNPHTVETKKNGLVTDEDGEIRYYVDGVAQYQGLVQDSDGNYYYINSTLKAVKNCTYGIGEAKTNGLLPAGIYTFDEDGKMVNPHAVEPEKNGLVTDEDGEIRYYVDGIAQYQGLVQDSDGNYYYINSTLKAVKNCTYGIGGAKTNGLLPAGTYTFGEDGKMVNPHTVEPEKNGLVTDEDGEIRYYVDGVAQYQGLVQDSDGNYYYINSTLKAVKNCTYGIGEAKTNGLLPAGTYTFGEDGKMINPPEAD